MAQSTLTKNQNRNKHSVKLPPWVNTAWQKINKPVVWGSIGWVLFVVAAIAVAVVILAQPGEMVDYNVVNVPPSPAHLHQYTDITTGEMVYMINPDTVAALVQAELLNVQAPYAAPEYVSCQALFYPGALLNALLCPNGMYEMVGFEVWVANNSSTNTVYIGLENHPFLSPGCWQVGDNVEGHAVYACPSS